MYYRNYLITYQWYKNIRQFVINCDGCKIRFDTVHEAKAFIDRLYQGQNAR